METLKPCRECNGVSLEFVELLRLGCIFVGCMDCGCATGTIYKTKEDAAAAWNHRPIEDALRARIVLLEAVLLRLKKAKPGGVYFQKWECEIDQALLPPLTDPDDEE